jgi:hypothetical protein
VDAAAEGQQVEIVMEEKEHILKSTLAKEEDPIEFLTQWEIELKMLKDWLDHTELEDGCQEIAKPEETCQHEEQLEEAGVEPVMSRSKE